MLIRSHECKPEGYEWSHKDMTLTVFSASNYYEEDSNKGAYLRITRDVTRGDAMPEIFQFQVKEGQTNTTLSSKLLKTEDKALSSLREKIFTLKKQLMEEFKKHDIKDLGTITLAQWTDSMRSVTTLDLPWRTLRTRLVESNMSDSKMVDYKTTFDLMTLQNKGELAPGEMEALYKHRATLTQIFNIMDKDKSGLVSRDEFIDACKVLRRATKNDMADKEIKLMAKNIDINQDGQIDINEFLEAFTLVSRKDVT